MDVAFRAPVINEPQAPLPEVENDLNRPVSGESDREPIEIRETEGRSIVLDALGITDDPSILPEIDKMNLFEVKGYVMEVMKSKGLGETVGAFKKTMNELKNEMGLDNEAEPSIVLDRIAGISKAWRNLSFLTDPQEKRRIFFRLANMKSSREMNHEVYKMMEKRSVWQ